MNDKSCAIKVRCAHDENTLARVIKLPNGLYRRRLLSANEVRLYPFILNFVTCNS